MEGSFFKRLWNRSGGSSSGPIKLNLEPAQAAPVQPRPNRPVSPPPPAEPIPGNFLLFEMFLQVPIGGALHIGSPKVAIRNMNGGEVRWGAKMELAFPGPNSVKAPWVDDAERGIAVRQIAKPEDILGAEGSIGEHQFRFERILDLGANVVVYSLLNLEKQFRLAYGFNRDAVEPGYVSPALQKALAKMAESKKNDVG
jgi:hypothetical protein